MSADLPIPADIIQAVELVGDLGYCGGNYGIVKGLTEDRKTQ